MQIFHDAATNALGSDNVWIDFSCTTFSLHQAGDLGPVGSTLQILR